MAGCRRSDDPDRVGAGAAGAASFLVLDGLSYLEGVDRRALQHRLVEEPVTAGSFDKPVTLVSKQFGDRALRHLCHSSKPKSDEIRIDRRRAPAASSQRERQEGLVRGMIFDRHPRPARSSAVPARRRQSENDEDVVTDFGPRLSRSPQLLIYHRCPW